MDKDKLLADCLGDYILANHTQEECIGFIDGFEKAIEVLKKMKVNEKLERE